MRGNKFSTWLLWALTVFFFTYQFVLRLSPGVLFEQIMVKFQIDATQFAIMSGAYYLGYAGMQIPLGIILDKFGIRYAVTTCVLICVIGNLPLIYSDSWTLVVAGRFLIGFGSAAGIIGAVKAIRIGFPANQVSKMIGWTITIGIIGAIYGKRINNLLIDAFGWQQAIIYLTIPGLVIAVLIYLFANNTTKTKEETFEGSVFEALVEVVKNPQILLLAIAGALLVGPLEAFADVWGSPFFVHVLNFSKTEADFLSASAIYFGMCVGSPLLAWIADKYQCHYQINITCGIVMALIFIAIINKFTNNYHALFALSFLIGIFSAYQVIVFASVTNIIPASISGITISYVNMINMGAGYAFHYGFGKIMDMSWSGDYIANMPHYVEKDYVNATYILPVTLIAGALLFFVISPKKRQIAETVTSGN